MLRGLRFAKLTGAPKVPRGTSGTESPQDTRCWKPAVLLLTGHHAQAPAAHSRTLPQGDGRAGPAFTRRAVGGECNLIVLDARDVLDNAFAVRCPGIDSEGKVSSQRAHLRPLLPHSSPSSHFTAAACGSSARHRSDCGTPPQWRRLGSRTPHGQVGPCC